MASLRALQYIHCLRDLRSATVIHTPGRYTMFKQSFAVRTRRPTQQSRFASAKRRPYALERLERREVLDASLQVIHNSPYDLIGSFDVYVNDVLFADNLSYQNATPFLTVPSGVNMDIDITDFDALDNSAPFYSTTVNLADGSSNVAIAYGASRHSARTELVSARDFTLGRTIRAEPGQRRVPDLSWSPGHAADRRDRARRFDVGKQPEHRQLCTRLCLGAARVVRPRRHAGRRRDAHPVVRGEFDKFRRRRSL